MAAELYETRVVRVICISDTAEPAESTKISRFFYYKEVQKMHEI